MNEQEIIKNLEVHKEELFKELSLINGKHDAIMNEIAWINSILEKIYNA